MQLFKRFMNEKKGSIFEYVILLSLVGVAAVLIFPHLREFTVDTFNTSVENITNGISGGGFSNDRPGNNNGSGTVENKYKFKFDGTNYVQLNDKLMDFGAGSSDFSLEGWFEINGTKNQDVFAKNGNKPFENQLILGIFRNSYHISTGFAVEFEHYNSSLPVAMKKKVHLAWIVEKNTFKLYENGIKVWEEAVGLRDTYTNEAAPTLGMETDNGLLVPSDYFVGTMHQVRLYNRALAANEVQNNMNGKTVRSNLQAEYLFNDGPGRAIKDYSGNGNDAYIVGNEKWEIEK